MMSHAMRGFFQHTAVRDCSAQAETCRMLGMKSEIINSAKVLLDFSSALFSAKGRIPRTMDGSPVVPYNFDPYRASFIAPDHLLTGHFRDCMSLAIKLLPSKEYRQTFEKFTLGFLKEAMLPTQNRLVDYERKALFQMSMTELYALSTVAYTALTAACNCHTLRSSVGSLLHPKCTEAICLVRSCAQVISNLWFYPIFAFDGAGHTQSFELDNGEKQLSILQRMISSHLDKVQSICTMRDMDMLLLDDPDCPREKKSEILNTKAATLIAIKAIDKPNIHRLRELAFTTLPMVGHVSRIGELVLEKCHQQLKRAIKNSNNRDIQMHCIRSVAFGDWQGRLTMFAGSAVEGCKTSLLGCYRLLAGRESLFSLHGTLSEAHYNFVRHVFGPGGCLAKELISEGRNVVSSRADHVQKNISWNITGETVYNRSSPTNMQKKYFNR